MKQVAERNMLKETLSLILKSQQMGLTMCTLAWAEWDEVQVSLPYVRKIRFVLQTLGQNQGEAEGRPC